MRWQGPCSRLPGYHAVATRSHRSSKTQARAICRRRGDIVVRHQQYLMDAVHAAPGGPDATRVWLLKLDEDNQGRRADVLVAARVRARVLDRARNCSESRAAGSPRAFRAYYYALASRRDRYVDWHPAPRPHLRAVASHLCIASAGPSPGAAAREPERGRRASWTRASRRRRSIRRGSFAVAR